MLPFTTDEGNNMYDVPLHGHMAGLAGFDAAAIKAAFLCVQMINSMIRTHPERDAEVRGSCWLFNGLQGSHKINNTK